MTAELVAFPERDLKDLPRALRALAESVEKGEYDEAHNLAWVMDCGSARIEVGFLGQSPYPGSDAHLLLALGQRKLEHAAMTP